MESYSRARTGRCRPNTGGPALFRRSWIRLSISKIRLSISSVTCEQGGFSTVSDRKDITELVQREAESQAGSDEGKTVDHGRVVDPVPGVGAFRLGQQAGLLVEAVRRGGDPNFASFLSDLHAAKCGLTFNCT